MTVRIAIVDDDEPYRAAIADLLRVESTFAVVGSYASASELPPAVPGEARAPWDLVLMDIEMPGMDGIAATAMLTARYPGVSVVMLTSFEEPERILRAILAGADGYLVKRSDAREVLEEIRAVIAGGSPLTPSVARSILGTIRREAVRPADRDALSDREAEVLRALVAGKGYKEIGFDLHISVDTVRTHIRNIYRKLQVHSAPAAVARAIRDRIV